MIKILIYNQYFLLDISGVDHLRLSAFHKLKQKFSLSVSGKEANKYLASSFPFSDFSIISSLSGCYFSKISCIFYFGQMFNGFLTSTSDLYWSLALQFSCIKVKLSLKTHFLLKYFIIEFWRFNPEIKWDYLLISLLYFWSLSDHKALFKYHMQFFQKVLVSAICWCNSIFWKFQSLLFKSIFIYYDVKNCPVCSIGMFYTILFTWKFFNYLARVLNFQHLCRSVSSSFSLLVLKIMAVKNFVFRENWIGRWLFWKQLFLPFLT